MVEYKTKLLPNSKLLDVSEYHILYKEMIHIPNNILNLERNVLPKVLPNLYRRALYLPTKRTPLLDNRLCKSNDGSEIPLTLEDIENSFKNNKNLEYHNVCREGYPIKKILDYEEYLKIKNFLSEKSFYLLFTEEVLKSLEAFYMSEMNIEKDLVINDFSNISSHITLVDEHYIGLGNLDEFLKYYNFKGDAFEIVKYEYFIFYMDILEKIKKKNPLSVRLKIVTGNVLALEYFASPSSRRYNINKNLVIEELLE